MCSCRRFVYVLKNNSSPPRYYTGVTSDVVKRLAQHNAGQSHHTTNGGRWHVDVVVDQYDETDLTREVEDAIERGVREAGRLAADFRGDEFLVNRELADTDVVLWYTFGQTHIPRMEDWPVMPVSSVGFSLKPDGFFNANPALDVPAPRR